MSLTTSRIDELRGSMLLVLEPSFISVLTNCYYGGKLANFPSTKAEFTATEERIIEIVSDGIGQCLAECLERSYAYNNKASSTRS